MSEAVDRLAAALQEPWDDWLYTGHIPDVVEITDALLADPAIAADLNDAAQLHAANDVLTVQRDNAAAEGKRQKADAAQLRAENERLRAIEDAARAYRKGVVAATDANLPDNSTELLQWAADEYRLSAALDTALAAYDAARAK